MYVEPALKAIDRLAASGSVSFNGELATKVWKRVVSRRPLTTERQAVKYRRLWKVSLQHDIRYHHYPDCADIVREFIQRAEKAKRHIDIDSFAKDTYYTKPTNIIDAWKNANYALLALVKAPCIADWSQLPQEAECYLNDPPLQP